MLNYISIGTGSEKVFFLHGWKMDHTCFDGMHSSLDKERFTFVFVDQRGYGLSKQQAGPYNIVQIAEDLIELADELKWSGFHFVGHSMAGKVLCRLIADAPHRVKSAVGITPCPPVKIPFDEDGWKLFSKAADDRLSREEVFRLATGNRLANSWYEFITHESMLASTPKAFSDYLYSWVNYAFHEEIIGSSVPIKLLAGEFDADITYDLMQETYGKWLSNVEISEIKNCGHYPMYETPLFLAAECEGFLKRFIKSRD